MTTPQASDVAPGEHQVLVASTDVVLIDGLVTLVAETGIATVVAQATTSNAVAARLRETSCEVVLVHDDIGPIPVLELVRELVTDQPETAVVVVTNEASDELLQGAMRAGARGVLAAPFQLEQVQAVLDSAGRWARSVRARMQGLEPTEGLHGGLVVLSGAKGGVGTSTLAVQLATTTAAAAPERNVCLVDLDLQSGDVRTLLDISHGRGIVDLVGVADDLSGRQLSDSLYPHDARLRVLLGPEEGEYGERVDEHAVRQVLAALRSRFDVVVVDAGTHVTDAAVVATEMADEVLLVVTPDVLCLRAAARRLELWSRLRIRTMGIQLVVNRASRDAEVQPDLVRRILADHPLAATVPASFRELEPAVNTGHPERAAESRVADGVRALGRGLGLVPATERRRWSPLKRQPAGLAATNGNGRVGDDAGGAVVEAIGLLPIVFVLAVVLLQVVLWGLTWMLAGHAAREGAHAALVGEDAVAVALADVPASWRPLASVSPSGGGVRVSLGVPSMVPFLDFSDWRVAVEVGNGGLSAPTPSPSARAPGGDA